MHTGSGDSLKLATFRPPWPRPCIRWYGILWRISHRSLPTYQISSKSEKIFVDMSTYGH